MPVLVMALQGAVGRAASRENPMRNMTAAFILALPVLAASASAQAFEPCADAALVLAVDGSDSIDATEYRFQQRAIAQALRDREVLAAFAEAGTVSVAVMFWGEASRPAHLAGAATIRDAGDAERLARAVESQPRLTRGTTGLGTGLAAALDQIAAMGCAHRAVINVTGDGKETILPRKRHAAVKPEQARDRASSEGVTINALVIAGAAPGLAGYFAGKVITGPDAFVMEIASHDDFAGALERKLIREIAPTVVSQRTGREP